MWIYFNFVVVIRLVTCADTLCSATIKNIDNEFTALSLYHLFLSKLCFQQMQMNHEGAQFGFIATVFASVFGAGPFNVIKHKQCT